jgi:hypothetical protein
MAKEVNVSRHSILRGLKYLKECHIIGIKKGGANNSNQYILYDRKIWRHRKEKNPVVHNSTTLPVVHNSTPVVHNSTISGAVVHWKETHRREHKKETQTTSPAASAADWNWPDYLKKMKTDPDRAIQIIALYLEYRGEKCDSQVQINGIIKRYIRIANDLKGFPDEQIRQTMIYLAHNRDMEFLRNKWNMDTIIKYILQVKVEANVSTRDYSGKMFS